jgi:hypothetical protein
MIVPKLHISQLAQLGTMQDELLSLTCRVRRIVASAFCEPLLFEHGVIGPSLGGCGIYHAHLHVIPMPRIDPIVSVLQRSHRFRDVSSMSALFDVQAEAYLYTEHASTGCRVATPDYLPSQYVRKIIAECLNLPEWDWRRCGWEDKLTSTLRALKGAFAKD